MSHRLASGGRLIDRARPVSFRFDGVGHSGFAGDTLASALMGAGRLLLGRSFKYHRPRGVVGSGPEEPNALVGIGTGGRFSPNCRATTTALHPGLEAASQNRWPSLEVDVGAMGGLFARFLPAGFYYKTFIHPRAFWKHVYEPFIRRAAGLGSPPVEPDADRYEQLYAFCDLLVAGGGVAGLQAALTSARAGGRVIVMEQAPRWGGRAPVDGDIIDGRPAEDWIAAAVAELSGMAHVTLRLNASVAGVHDHAYVIADEALDQPEQPGTSGTPGAGPSHRLWRIRAGRIVMATGAIERPLAFAGNDLPGVMLASAVRDFVVNWAVVPGQRVVVVANNDDAYRTALKLHAAGVEVPAIVDARDAIAGGLPARARAAGLRIVSGAGVAAVKGSRQVSGVALCRQSGNGAVLLETIACDGVAMSGGWSPAVHLWSHCGGKLVWDEAQAHFRPDLARGPIGHDGAAFVYPAGAAAGCLQAAPALADADRAARAALAALGRTPPAAPAATAEAVPEAPMAPVWMMPARAEHRLRAKMWLDFQNDVKVSDIELAAREGFRSVEHAKRYTTLGMATDQGKLSNINGLAVLSEALHEAIPQVGTTTFRPPWTPIPLGVVAGEAHGPLFQPLRRTPMHDWHAAHGARWEPVGQWRRPYCYLRPGETVDKSVTREVRNTRQAVGLLDASTLGKLLVRGPDAPRFMDMLYTGMMSSLKPGHCRYGLMCDENGFLMDDGVVARLSDDSFLCHTTSGGADRIHGWMEDWLQCEWWDWKVHVANLTEQFAQIVVAGPRARAVLERLGGLDLSDQALPFMRWVEGQLAGMPVRVFRISFSGELSFELAVPANRGLALWERLMAAGAEFGAMPYGTEALHIMRAEKGFIMIGDETDGTVIPQDLGLDWAISKKKADFLGKRGLERAHMRAPDRWRLVGLETLDGAVLPTGAYAVTERINDNDQRETEGRVTSSYFSPTLGRGIAMGLVRRGPERMGEVLRFPAGEGRSILARIVAPRFFDPEGERLNA